MPCVRAAAMHADVLRTCVPDPAVPKYLLLEEHALDTSSLASIRAALEECTICKRVPKVAGQLCGFSIQLNGHVRWHVSKP